MRRASFLSRALPRRVCPDDEHRLLCFLSPIQGLCQFLGASPRCARWSLDYALPSQRVVHRQKTNTRLSHSVGLCVYNVLRFLSFGRYRNKHIQALTLSVHCLFEPFDPPAKYSRGSTLVFSLKCFPRANPGRFGTGPTNN